MKILYISNSSIPSKMTNSINVIKMCQAFADNGHEVTLLAPNIKNEYEKKIIDPYDFYGVKKNFKIKKLWYPNIKGNFIFYTLAIFLYLIFNKKFDLVYGRFLYGCFAATLFKKKVIYESHKPMSDRDLKIFKIFITNKKLIKIIVISQALKNIYLEKKYFEDLKIQVAHDGADEQIDLSPHAKLKGSKYNLKVGYVGHLYKGKGMEVIAKIVEKISSNVEIHIIGGHEKDVNYWKKKIINTNVYFYGFVPPKEVNKYIRALDICLLPNQKEVFTSNKIKSELSISKFTSPLKLFEYMSNKKAIISSDFPVIREVLNEQNSILVKFDDIESWVKSIEKLQESENRKKIANCAFNDFKYYTWKNRASLVIKNFTI